MLRNRTPSPPKCLLTKSYASCHFYPKFDNTGSGKEPDVVSLLSQDNDVMVVTKKHSGSLVLVHSIYENDQWKLVVNSKNGTNNEFSIPAEYYLRAQFKATFGQTTDEKFTEFVSFMGEHSITMSFEFVTPFLGDHGDKPLLSYAVLVAISQFNDENRTSRFFGIPEMVEMGVKFRLILNEMWVVPREKAAAVASALHDIRWTGWDHDFTVYLDDQCTYKVHSLLPHGAGQGALLEGLVVQACRTTSEALSSLQDISGGILSVRDALLAGLNEFSASPPVGAPSFCPPDASGSVSDTAGLLKDLSQLGADGGVNDGSSLQQMLQYLSELPPNKLRFFNFKRIQRGNNISYIVHVHQDQIFFDYHKNKPESAAQLYRGLEVYTQRERPLSSSIPPYESSQSSSTWEILGISKWKNWNYLKRTFCMRNPLKGLFADGYEAFMLQVRRQFVNWGLPDQLLAENTAMLSAWGHWMLENKEAKIDFETKRNTFSYLSYVDRFLPEYAAGNMHFDDESTPVNTVLLIYCFENKDYSDLLAPLMKGYTATVLDKKAKKSKGVKYRPGNVYTMEGSWLPKSAECSSPFFTIVVPPSEDCIERKTLGMFESFRDHLSEPLPCPVSYISNPEVDVPATQQLLQDFNAAHMPKTKYLICMPGMQPGSGKSTLAEYLRAACEERGMTATVVSSDFFGMKHAADVPSGNRKSSSAKEEFEEKVVEALRSAEVEVVIYDKNIPNMAGYNCMRSVAERAGILKLVVVPVVPDSCTQAQADRCLERVLQREKGTHTLTKDVVIAGYESVGSFVHEVFAQPCMDFIPVASLLPGAFVVPNFHSLESINDLRSVAVSVVDELCGGSQEKQSSTELDVTTGTYLSLEFELDSATKAYFEKVLRFGVRQSVHVTIQHYGQDGERMKQAAQILRSADISNNGRTKSVVVTRLARVLQDGLIHSDNSSEAKGRVLAWASCVVEGFEDLPLHITLAADGFKNSDAREGEIAYSDGILNLEGAEFPIEQFAIEPVTFEATWSIN